VEIRDEALEQQACNGRGAILAAFPPVLSRRFIASPEAQDRASYRPNLPHPDEARCESRQGDVISDAIWPDVAGEGIDGPVIAQTWLSHRKMSTCDCRLKRLLRPFPLTFDFGPRSNASNGDQTEKAEHYSTWT
jgi:hypothetical protein